VDGECEWRFGLGIFLAPFVPEPVYGSLDDAGGTSEYEEELAADDARYLAHEYIDKYVGSNPEAGPISEWFVRVDRNG
jgi:hypothetical protein